MPPFTIPSWEGAARRVAAGWTPSHTPPRPSPRGASTTTINISSCRGHSEGRRQKQQESNLLSQLLFSQQKGRGRGKAWLELGLPVCGLGERDGTGWNGTGQGSWGRFASRPPWPPAPAAPSSSPSPLHHFCFIYECVAGIQMSYLFCGRLTFPQRATSCLTQGPAETVREEKERAKECFSALFYSPPPSLLILFCVSVRRTLPCLSPSPPLLPFHPLGPALAPFMLHDSSNGSPGGSYRECIGSLGERKPPTSYTPDV